MRYFSAETSSIYRFRRNIYRFTRNTCEFWGSVQLKRNKIETNHEFFNNEIKIFIKWEIRKQLKNKNEDSFMSVNCRTKILVHFVYSWPNTYINTFLTPNYQKKTYKVLFFRELCLLSNYIYIKKKASVVVFILKYAISL